LANYLEENGKGSRAAKRILLRSKTSAGDAWAKYVLMRLGILDRKQRRIRFYGKNSARRFKRRMGALKRLTSTSEQYYPGARPMTRAKIAKLLFKSHKHLGKTILASRIPKGLSLAKRDKLKDQLEEMAEPFFEKAKEYEDLARKEFQIAKEREEEKPKLARLIRPRKLESLHRRLHKSPRNRRTLEKIQEIYEDHGHERLASYFRGRIAHLDQEDRS